MTTGDYSESASIMMDPALDPESEAVPVLPPLAAESPLADGPSRPLFQRLAYPPRLSINGLLIAVLGSVLIVAVGFLPFPVPSPLNLGSSVASYDQLQMIQYSVQLPLMITVGTLLGPFMGVLAVLLFLTVGLVAYPVFASGGGLQYVFQPGFGYLLGGLLCAGVASQRYHTLFQRSAETSTMPGGSIINLFKMVFGLVLTFHAIGIVYLIGLGLGHQLPWETFPGLVLRLSGEPLIYDFAATAVMLGLVRQLRFLLLFVLY